MNTDWRSKTIRPGRERAPKMNLYPCPGICRFFAMLGFLGLSLGVYYGGAHILDVQAIDWLDPHWTPAHVGLLVAGLLVGAVAGVALFGAAMMIKVESERLSDFFIVLWQFLASGTFIWFVTIGVAMSLSLGKEEAKAAVLSFGAERATLHALGSGVVVSLGMAVGFVLGPLLRLNLVAYLLFSMVFAALAGRWHYGAHGIDGQAWIAVGIVFPLATLLVALGMIERDRRERRLAIEMNR